MSHDNERTVQVTVKVQRDLSSRLAETVATVRGHDEHARFVELVAAHGVDPTTIVDDLVATKVKEAAQSYAARELALLAQLVNLLEQIVAVVAEAPVAGVRFRAAAGGLADVAGAAERLAERTVGDRHELAVLHTILRDRSADRREP